jgi:hypothetical protein
MNEDDKKRLAEFLGDKLCKKPEELNCVDDPNYCCSYCEHMKSGSRRTFTTPQDMMNLKEMLVKKGMWDNFRIFSDSIYVSHGNPTWSGFIDWIMNAPRFCKLVASFLSEEKT